MYLIYTTTVTYKHGQHENINKKLIIPRQISIPKII